MPRPTHVFKKKKIIFTGCVKQNTIPVTTGVLVESATDRPNPICSRPSPSTTDSELVPPKRISSSKRKLSKYLKDYKQYEDKCSPNDLNDILNIKDLESLLSKIAVCSECGGKLSVHSSNRLGLSSTISVVCDECGLTVSKNNSSTVGKGKSAVNVRLAYAVRCIGKGMNAAKTFCAVMNLPKQNLLLLNIIHQSWLLLLKSFAKIP